MADNESETLPLECSDPMEGQSVPCPPAESLPGPTCDPDGQLPQLAQEPEQQEVITVNGPSAPPPFCWNPKGGYKQEVGPGGIVETGPGAQLRIGSCGVDDDGKPVRDSFDLNGEFSMGKLSKKTGNVTTEVERLSGKAGIAINPRGESRLGVQLNGAQASTEYGGPNGTVKVGASSGGGFEVRGHNGRQVGIGVDVGPFSGDIKVGPRSVQR